MKQIVFAIILSFLFLPTFAMRHQVRLAEVSGDTVKMKKLINEIAKENVFILVNPKNTDQPGSYKKLIQSGSVYDFLRIAMDNKNPVVRLYAFRAVASRMDNLPAELVMKFKNDTTLITVRSGTEEKQVPVNQVANGYLK